MSEIHMKDTMHHKYIYSQDVSNAPLMGLFLKTADSVYQPRNEQEVFELLKMAKAKRLPIIPRGAATSGYGGVLPLKGGIIIDFTRMSSFDINEDEMVVECEPGAIWWDIEKKLNRRGLSLRVYPSSAPSSTVGGWIAQNGYGYGSLKYGGIADNVVKLRVVDFNGVKEVEGSQIKRYIGMEGTTGLIVKAWIKIKEQEDMRYYAFFVSPEEAEKIVYSTGNHYTALYFDKDFIKLKNKAFGTHMPERDTLMVATTEKLDGNEELGEEIWETKFYPMRIKKLGPSLVVAENILPSDKISEYIMTLKRKIRGINCSEVCYINDKRGAVLTYILSDERKLTYPLTWRYSLKALKIAKSMGGTPYSTGLFLSSETRNLLGKDYPEILEFKREVDPDRLLNPGKVFPAGVVPLLIKIAGLVA